MLRDLVIDERITIPARELSLSFARSSGPGGQNVNKVATKAVLRWSVASSAAIDDPTRARLVAALGRRVTGAGELILASDSHRDQPQNVAECLARLRALVRAAATPPRTRRPTRKPRSANEARLREKQIRSRTKQGRSRPEE